jgi:hypothetical protein
MKKLDGLTWRQRNITELGCIKGGLDYLGRDISFPWLYGGTAFAFVLNIHQELDPSGPTCWDTRPIRELAPNLGYKVSGISVEKEAAGDAFPAYQRQAWDFVRASLDRGLPCYGWEVDPYIPDYSVINGYEDGEGGGYLYSGWVTGGPRDWRTLGETDVKVLQVYSIELVDPAPDEKVIQDALAAVLQHSATPSGWFSHPGYATGPAGFDLWAESLETGRAVRDGHCYNTATWLECREMAVEFLYEARQRLPGRSDAVFDAVAAHYSAVCDCLREALALHPNLHPETWDSETHLQSTEAAALMRQAAAAERQALASLAKLLSL